MERSYIRSLLESSITQLVTTDYILLDLPYYTNIGDVLIWQSTIDLLKKIPQRCLYTSSIESYIKPNIDNHVLIIFMGGGNFGDLWKRHQDFRHKVMRDFPQNPILQLPQSVCFNDPENIGKDIKFFSEHKGAITICLREMKSYHFIKKHYETVRSCLLPDLALYFDIESFVRKHKIVIKEGKGNLILRRNDKEEVCYDKHTHDRIPLNAYVSDWPTMTTMPEVYKSYYKWQCLLKRMRVPWIAQMKFMDFYYKNIVKDAYIKSGITFLNEYKNVYSTRLHGAILAYLMKKQVYILDNSYAKCSGVYNCWLENQSNIRML